MSMLGDLRCLLGFHKPARRHYSIKYKCRTTNKGRSKKRWYTGARELFTVTYCERCGKELSRKSKLKWR